MDTTKEQLARLALAQYGLADAEIALLQDMWNTTFCTTDTTGQKYNLRISGGSLQDAQRIEDECVFLDFLAQRQQVRVPKPVYSVDGQLVAKVEAETESGETEQRLCCLFEWIDGTTVSDNLTESVAYKMGSNTATLQQATQAFRFPTPTDPFRKGYDYDETVILQHREWLAQREAEIVPERVQLINSAIDYVLGELGKIEKTRTNYGYIHGDINPNNFIVTDPGLATETVSVIDFEQLGRGFFQSEFATMKEELIYLTEGADALWTSFKQGYQSVAPLPFDHDDELVPFIMMIDLNFLDWLYNTPSPNVRTKWHDRFEATHDKIRQVLE